MYRLEPRKIAYLLIVLVVALAIWWFDR
jgi:hypothetical protein